MGNKKLNLMRYPEACQELGISRNKMRELARQAGAMYKINQAVVIDMNRLMAYLDEYYRVSPDD